MITALQMFSLDAVNATEFLEVYKGVLPPGEFSGMLDELTSGMTPQQQGSSQPQEFAACSTMLFA